ncbi:MAG: ATP-binding protein [Ginsengibacter sp.]
MFLEILLSFLLLLRMRKTLRTFHPNPKWDKYILYAIIGVGVLFSLDTLVHADEFAKWFWHIVLLAIVAVFFIRDELITDRLIINAVLPLILISLVGDILEATPIKIFKTLSQYMDYAYPVAITWMIALLVRSKKQQKVLLEERQKREEDLKEYRMMTERKAELERLVTERTSELVSQKEELEQAINDLKSTQAQLVQREKMASLGELTAGIAHEIQNPLNFVNNFSEVSVELTDELQHEINSLLVNEPDKIHLSAVIKDIRSNQEKINYHGKRADSIVKGMLLHSRKSSGQKEQTDINMLADEYIQLSYHGLRAKDKSFNATLDKHYDETLDKINVVPQDMGRVFLNLFTNSFYSVTEKKQQKEEAKEPYEPIVSVYTKKLVDTTEIRIKDNGMGMSREILDKIFQPFFTTKPTGQGTGLGLSISYDIVTKIHGGQMTVNTEEGEFAEFVLLLPAIN